MKQDAQDAILYYLHSTVVLLKLLAIIVLTSLYLYLHSTVVLLKLFHALRYEKN